jgi:hypothetical protein
MKRSSWRWYLGLLVAVLVVACDQAGEAEKLVASAEQSRQAGQLKVAADLYHRAADLREGDFDTLYQAALQPLREAVRLDPHWCIRGSAPRIGTISSAKFDVLPWH